MRRFILSIAACTGAFFLAHGTAKADCGMSEFSNNAAPLLKQWESIPINKATIFHQDGDNANPNRTTVPSNISYGVIQDCPDASATVNYGVRELENLWIKAIQFQNDVAVLHFVATGQANQTGATELPGCAPIRKAEIIADYTATWSSAIQVTKPSAKYIKSTPYFSHINGLYKSLAADLGITFRPFASEPITVWNAMVTRNQTLRAHLPDSLHNCDDIIPFAYQR